VTHSSCLAENSGPLTFRTFSRRLSSKTSPRSRTSTSR
jgi:hypothetical protein